MNLNELEALAKGLHSVGDTAMITNPETILRLIELVREMADTLDVMANCGTSMARDQCQYMMDIAHESLAKYKEMLK